MSIAMKHLKSFEGKRTINNNILITLEVLKSVYVIFRNESQNGQKGINNNYIGLQADGGRWSPSFDKYFTGITFARENKTNNCRIFLTFKDTTPFYPYVDCFNILVDRVANWGLYVGGKVNYEYVRKDIKYISDVRTLSIAYNTGYVGLGNPSELDIKEFISEYNNSIDPKYHSPNLVNNI